MKAQKPGFVKLFWFSALLLGAIAINGCIVVSPDPVTDPGPGPGMSVSQMKNIARNAVFDDIIYRHGSDSRPHTSSVGFEPYDANEGIVFGRVSYFAARGKVFRNFECSVNRFSGHIRGLRYY